MSGPASRRELRETHIGPSRKKSIRLPAALLLACLAGRQAQAGGLFTPRKATIVQDRTMGRASVCAPEGCEAGRRASKVRFLLSVVLDKFPRLWYIAHFEAWGRTS